MGKKLSEEKIKELENAILENPGWSNKTIANLVGTGTSSVSTYRKKLIQEGRITKERIDEAKEQKKAGEKAENKAKDPRRTQVLAKLEEGESYYKISEDTHIPTTTLSKIIKELIEDGETSQEKIDEARAKKIERDKEAEKENPQGIREVTDELMERVLEELDKGLIGRRITKKLGLGKGIFAKIRRKLINSGRITSEEIKRAELRRRHKDKEEVYNYRMKGCSIQEMLSLIEDSEEDYLIELEKELKEEGRLSNEKIKQAKYERKYQQISDFVLDGYNSGLNAREISEAYELIFGERLGQRNVSYYKEKLIARGLTTEDEIKSNFNNKDDNEKENLMQEYEGISEYDEKLMRLMKLGFSDEEIEEALINEERALIERRLKALTKNGIINRDKKRAVTEMKRKIGLMLCFKKDLDIDVAQDYIEYAKAQFYLGSLKDAEVKELRNVMLMDTSFVSLSNVNLVTTYYTRNKNHEQAMDFIDECVDVLEPGDNKRAILKRVKSVIEENMNKRKIINKGSLPKKPSPEGAGDNEGR